MRRRDPQKGYALVVALLVITLLFAGGALLSQDLVVSARLLREETRELHLQSVLDSAVAKIMAKYRADVYFEGREEVSIDGGKAVMDATIVGGPVRRVEIAAEYHGLRRNIVIQLYANVGDPIRLTDHRPAALAAGRLQGSE